MRGHGGRYRVNISEGKNKGVGTRLDSGLWIFMCQFKYAYILLGPKIRHFYIFFHLMRKFLKPVAIAASLCMVGGSRGKRLDVSTVETNNCRVMRRSRRYLVIYWAVQTDHWTSISIIYTYIYTSIIRMTVDSCTASTSTTNKQYNKWNNNLR